MTRRARQAPSDLALLYTIKGGNGHAHAVTVVIAAAQREAFQKKFGRDPGPGDSVFFDPDADTPTPMTPDRIERSLERVRARPASTRTKRAPALGNASLNRIRLPLLRASNRLSRVCRCSSGAVTAQDGNEFLPFVYTATQFRGRRQWLMCIKCGRGCRTQCLD